MGVSLEEEVPRFGVQKRTPRFCGWRVQRVVKGCGDRVQGGWNWGCQEGGGVFRFLEGFVWGCLQGKESRGWGAGKRIGVHIPTQQSAPNSSRAAHGPGILEAFGGARTLLGCKGVGVEWGPSGWPEDAAPLRRFTTMKFLGPPLQLTPIPIGHLALVS